MNVSVLQYGVVRHIGDELLIVVPESDSATDPKKQVWGQQFFFSCWLKGTIFRKLDGPTYASTTPHAACC